MRVRRFLIVLLVCVGALASIASGEETATSVDGEEGSGDASGGEGEVQSFAVGEAVALGDYQIVVHGVTDPLPPALLPPQAGNRYVAVDTEVTNNSDQPAAISTLVQFEVQDDTNASYQIALTDHGLPSLDGEAPAGGSRRGTMVFEVPEAASGLKLNFIGDLFSSGSATIQLT